MPFGPELPQFAVKLVFVRPTSGGVHQFSLRGSVRPTVRHARSKVNSRFRPNRRHRLLDAADGRQPLAPTFERRG